GGLREAVEDLESRDVGGGEARSLLAGREHAGGRPQQGREDGVFLEQRHDGRVEPEELDRGGRGGAGALLGGSGGGGYGLVGGRGGVGDDRGGVGGQKDAGGQHRLGGAGQSGRRRRTG